MPNYEAFNQGLQGLSEGVSGYTRAREILRERKRQEAQDALSKQFSDLKLSEGTPSVPTEGFMGPGAPMATRSEALELRGKMLLADKAARAAREKANMMSLTPGQKAADVAFGKELPEYTTSGQAQAEKGLSALLAAKGELTQPKEGSPGEVEPREGISGPWRGAFPDWFRSFSNPEAVQVKENIRGAVMNTLRATLGAQFTEKEGERIFNLAYNDRLPAAQNIERLDRTIKALQDQKAAKESQMEHFQQFGTLKGWKGSVPTLTDADITGEGQAPSASGAPAPGQIEDGYKFIGGDPSNPQSWQRVQ